MELSSLDLNHETASTLGSQGSEACFRRFAGKIDWTQSPFLKRLI